MLHGNPTVEIRLKDVLDECRTRSSLWRVFKLESVLNTSGVSDVRQVRSDCIDVEDRQTFISFFTSSYITLIF